MPELSSIDTYGQKITENYSVILTELLFERRLRNFDPNLRLMFDQVKKRWVILEWAYDNSGWNCILIAQDKEGNPKPLGDWVFNQLFVKRHNYEVKRSMGVDAYIKHLEEKAKIQKQQIAENASDDNQAMIRDNITQWRKAAKELDNGAPADAKAGYRQI